EDIPALGERVERRPALGQVVGTGECDDRAQALLFRGRAWTVDAAHADPHQPDPREVEAALVRRDVVEKRRNDARPIGADRKARRVLSLPGPVDAQRGESAAEEI